MSVSFEQAQASAIVCWRQLLRKLDTLTPQQATGQHNAVLKFVAEGTQTPHGFQSIVEFFTADFPMGLAARQEIFGANIEDILSLNILQDFPSTLFTSHEDPHIAQRIAHHQLYLQVHKNIEREYRTSKLENFLSSSERFVIDLDQIDELKKQLMVYTVVSDEYLPWVIDKIVACSFQQVCVLSELETQTLHTLGQEATASSPFSQLLEQRRTSSPSSLHSAKIR